MGSRSGSSSDGGSGVRSTHDGEEANEFLFDSFVEAEEGNPLQLAVGDAEKRPDTDPEQFESPGRTAREAENGVRPPDVMDPCSAKRGVPPVASQGIPVCTAGGLVQIRFIEIPSPLGPPELVLREEVGVGSPADADSLSVLTRKLAVRLHIAVVIGEFVVESSGFGRRASILERIAAHDDLPSVHRNMEG